MKDTDQHTFLHWEAGNHRRCSSFIPILSSTLQFFSCGAFTFVAVILFSTLGQIRQCSSKVDSFFSLVSRESVGGILAVSSFSPRFLPRRLFQRGCKSGPPGRMSSHARVAKASSINITSTTGVRLRGQRRSIFSGNRQKGSCLATFGLDYRK